MRDSEDLSAEGGLAVGASSICIRRVRRPVLTTGGVLFLFSRSEGGAGIADKPVAVLSRVGCSLPLLHRHAEPGRVHEQEGALQLRVLRDGRDVVFRLVTRQDGGERTGRVGLGVSPDWSRCCEQCEEDDEREAKSAGARRVCAVARGTLSLFA